MGQQESKPSVQQQTKPEMSSVASLIESLIKSNKVMIFSKSYCPYCKNAKKQFEEMKQAFHAIELDQMKNGDEIQKELLERTKQRTVPSVWIKGKHIGGSDDTVRLRKSGELEKMLQ